MSMMLNAMVNLAWTHVDQEEARGEIWAALGDLSGFRLFGSQVLLADYMRPVKTRGGIITTDQSEDIFQGVLGMVVLIGPTAWRASVPSLEGALYDVRGEFVG